MNKLAIGALVAVAGLFLLSKKKKNNPSVNATGTFNKPTEDEIKQVFLKIGHKYDMDTARQVEKIYRAETNHFKSGQYLASGSPGMLKHKADFPFGWVVENALWSDPAYRPVGEVTFNKNGKDYTYLVFPDFQSAAFSLAEYVKEYGPLRWNSTDETAQASYKALLDSIIPRYCNEILPI